MFSTATLPDPPPLVTCEGTCALPQKAILQTPLSHLRDVSSHQLSHQDPGKHSRFPPLPHCPRPLILSTKPLETSHILPSALPTPGDPSHRHLHLGDCTATGWPLPSPLPWQQHVILRHKQIRPVPALTLPGHPHSTAAKSHCGLVPTRLSNPTLPGGTMAVLQTTP